MTSVVMFISDMERAYKEAKSMNLKNIQVIFHRDHDGVAAAYCAWRIFGDAAEYRTIQYGEPFPTLPADSRVFILDFSWPDNKAVAHDLAVAILNEAERHSEFVIIDHHAGPVEEALEWVSRLAAEKASLNFDYRFDKTKSGVELAYEYFRAYSPEAKASWPQRIPYPLQLIGDRDLWRHENEPDYPPIDKANCQALHAGLFLIPYKWGEPEWFEQLHAIVIGSQERLPSDVEPWLQVIREGMVALRVQQTNIEAICKNAYFAPYETGETAPAWLPTVDSSIMQSEIAHHLLSLYPAYVAAVVRYRKAGTDKWSAQTVHSIRSRKGSDAALTIARANRGGGHPSAAGFTLESHEL
jgi:oligoribonuclease NrnB/cAMP/cGMP phosphodiesterase (DHH superfamily)